MTKGEIFRAFIGAAVLCAGYAVHFFAGPPWLALVLVGIGAVLHTAYMAAG